jgi:hypothetical protein
VYTNIAASNDDSAILLSKSNAYIDKLLLLKYVAICVDVRLLYISEFIRQVFAICDNSLVKDITTPNKFEGNEQ